MHIQAAQKYLQAVASFPERLLLATTPEELEAVVQSTKDSMNAMLQAAEAANFHPETYTDEQLKDIIREVGVQYLGGPEAYLQDILYNFWADPADDTLFDVTQAEKLDAMLEELIEEGLEY